MLLGLFEVLCPTLVGLVYTWFSLAVLLLNIFVHYCPLAYFCITVALFSATAPHQKCQNWVTDGKSPD
jgi:hypothetical protein